MAVVRENPLLEGISGRVGDLVFRVRAGRTIVSRRPRRRGPPPQSETRERTVSRFREAVAFAREARHAPAFRSLSRVLRGYSPYHIALQDYLSVPVIEQVDDSGVGPEGGVLLVEVSERIDVRSVVARLLGESGARAVSGERVPGGGLSRSRRVGPRPREGEPSGRPGGPHGGASPPGSTPAEIFFRRPAAELPPGPGRADGSAAADAAGGQPSGLPAHPSAPDPGERAEPSAGAPPGRRLTTWKVRIPVAGEVEVVASDYAGNRAVLTLSVPGRGSPAGPAGGGR